MMGKHILPDYSEFDMLMRDAEYIRDQVMRISRARPGMRNQYEQKTLLFLSGVVVRLKKGSISKQHASILFSCFIPFAYDFFEDRLSSLVCSGSCLDLPNRPQSLQSAVTQLESEIRSMLDK